MKNYDKIEMELSKISNDILKDCYNNIEEALNDLINDPAYMLSNTIGLYAEAILKDQIIKKAEEKYILCFDEFDNVTGYEPKEETYEELKNLMDEIFD